MQLAKWFAEAIGGLTARYQKVATSLEIVIDDDIT